MSIDLNKKAYNDLKSINPLQCKKPPTFDTHPKVRHFFGAYHSTEGFVKLKQTKKSYPKQCSDKIVNGDSYENRTRVTAVKGRCLDRLTKEPFIW